MKTVPLAPVPSSDSAPVSASVGAKPEVTVGGQAPIVKDERMIDRLNSVPELAGIPGPLFKTSEPVELTESETEYVVKCYKHCYPNHIVLQVW